MRQRHLEPGVDKMSLNDSIINIYKIRGYQIEFQGTTNITKVITFNAFIKSFNDEYSSDWNSENTFGFWDRIHIFRQTRRRINFGIDIPSVDEDEAKLNFDNVRLLGRAMYPSYKNTSGYNVIDKSPLMRIRFSNLITTEEKGGGQLYGKIDSISISPDFEAGFFDVEAGVLYPKLLQLDISFDVMHTEDPLYLSNSTLTSGSITGINRLQHPNFSTGEAQIPFPQIPGPNASKTRKTGKTGNTNVPEELQTYVRSVSEETALRSTQKGQIDENLKIYRNINKVEREVEKSLEEDGELIANEEATAQILRG
jgi:hypothetical protein